MVKRLKLLIDTNIIFSLLVKTDPNHTKALTFFSRQQASQYQVVTNDYILQETYTVLLFAIKTYPKLLN